jgi:hypothetical protein
LVCWEKFVIFGVKMKFFFGYLAVGTCMVFWLYKVGYFHESVRLFKARGMEEKYNSSHASAEDIILLSLCVSGLFLWPVFLLGLALDWARKP